MSENAPETPAESPAPEADSTPVEPNDPTDTDATEAEEEVESFEGWDPKKALEKIRKTNAEARKQRERAKTAESTVADKDKQIVELSSQLQRERVARKLNLPNDDSSNEFLSRLRGETYEELLEDAEKLLGLMEARSAKNTPPPGRRPTEDLKPGRDPEVVIEEIDPAKLAAKVRAKSHRR